MLNPYHTDIFKSDILFIELLGKLQFIGLNFYYHTSKIFIVTLSPSCPSVVLAMVHSSCAIA